MAETTDKKTAEHGTSHYNAIESFQYLEMEDYGSFISSTATSSQDHSDLSPDENILPGILARSNFIIPSEPEGIMQDSTAIEDGEMWTEENVAVLRIPAEPGVAGAHEVPARDLHSHDALDDAFVLGRSLSTPPDATYNADDQPFPAGQKFQIDPHYGKSQGKNHEAAGTEPGNKETPEMQDFGLYSSGFHDHMNMTDGSPEIHFLDQKSFIDAEAEAVSNSDSAGILNDSIIQWKSPIQKKSLTGDDDPEIHHEDSDIDMLHMHENVQAIKTTTDGTFQYGTIMESEESAKADFPGSSGNQKSLITVEFEKESVREIPAGPIVSGRESAPKSQAVSDFVSASKPIGDETIQSSTATSSTRGNGNPDNRFTPEFVQEISDMFMYMDRLLESLPDSKIEEFARSNHFETYRHIFEVLGLV